jgi:hypothetical protein
MSIVQRTSIDSEIQMTSPTQTRRDGLGGSTPSPVEHRSRRLSTETKAAFKTTEFFAFLAAVAAVLIAAAVIDNSDSGGFGARQAWLYVTVLTVGYMVSRGLAKSGTRDPSDAGAR